METADFNYEDFNANKMSEMDKNLMVKFYLKPRIQKAESKRMGRPIYKDIEYIDMRVPGSRTNMVARPASPEDKARFPEHYARFQARHETPELERGTPLNQYPLISSGQIEVLTFLNVKTVEELAGMNDGDAGQIMGGMTLKADAIRWLEMSKDHADKNEMAEVIEKQNVLIAQLNDRLDVMEANTAEAPELLDTPEVSEDGEVPDSEPDN